MVVLPQIVVENTKYCTEKSGKSTTLCGKNELAKIMIYSPKLPHDVVKRQDFYFFTHYIKFWKVHIKCGKNTNKSGKKIPHFGGKIT